MEQNNIPPPPNSATSHQIIPVPTQYNFLTCVTLTRGPCPMLGLYGMVQAIFTVPVVGTWIQLLFTCKTSHQTMCLSQGSKSQATEA